ncbi:MAG: hypothetical protein DLM59_07685 [Pseudonocardiales bacterium]|nr:MAG: hypothetical protein DLM59_07685 [Pseudonocardiales bacterium]
MGSTRLSDGFSRACHEILPALCSTYGLRTWLVTARIGSDEVLVEHHGASPKVVGDRQWAWAQSPVTSQLAGITPSVAPRVSSVPIYAGSPVVVAAEAQSMIAAPMVSHDRVLGGLYGLDRGDRTDDLLQAAPVVHAAAALLGELYEPQVSAGERDPGIDDLSGLANRAGWQQRLSAEDGRCARYGRSSGVIVVDVDELRRVTDSLGPAAGDDLLLRTAGVLRRGSRAWHTVGRTGRDEFAILAVEADHDDLAGQVRRLRMLLRSARVRASLGWAVREPGGGLSAAWLAAEQQMFSAKRARRARRVQARGVRQMGLTANYWDH